MEVKKIIGSLKKRGIKGSYLRWKNGNPKINTIDFWSFITNQTTIPFNKEGTVEELFVLSQPLLYTLLFCIRFFLL